jgi:FtsP/CotA-like multicopper oxidase with cupredoxin domain
LSQGDYWDYSLFSTESAPEKIHATMPMVISSVMGNGNQFEQWLINGQMHRDSDKPTTLRRGERYRFAFQNNTDDAHPLHFHRSIFEMVRIDGRSVTGLRKDTFLLKAFGSAEVDLAPTEPGLMLFHCHNQFHMDSGFKRIFNVV